MTSAGLRIAALYALFAVVASAANLAAQRAALSALGQGPQPGFGWVPAAMEALGAVVGVGWAESVGRVGEGTALAAAIVVGTGVGLVVKYVLDKRWIFDDRSRGVRAHARRFSLYTLMGVATTSIFWGAEAVAWAVWRTDAAREIGAALGLCVGYLVKYRLDRRYVFTAEEVGDPASAAR